MKKNKILIEYDEEGDYMELYFEKIKKGYFQEIKKDVFERRDERTGKLVGYAIFNFRNRKQKILSLELSLPEGIKI